MAESLKYQAENFQDEGDCQSQTSTTDSKSEPESLYWDDSHLKDFITIKLPKLDIEDEIKISYQFLIYIFTGLIPETSQISQLHFLTASFLRCPDNPNKRLLVSLDSNASEINFDHNYICRGDLFLDQLLRKHHFGAPITFCYFRESLLRIRGNGIVAFASYLAVTIYNKGPKNWELILNKLSTELIDKFNFYFPRYEIIGTLPEIRLEVLSRLSSKWPKLGFAHFLPFVLGTFKRKHCDTKVNHYLFTLLLGRTYCYGVPLIKHYLNVKKMLENHPEILEKCCYDYNVKESFELLKEFEQNVKAKSILWPWARLLSKNYFEEYSCKYQLDFHVILIVLLEALGKPSLKAWNRLFLQHNKLVELKAKVTKIVGDIVDNIQREME